jgi:hypothetical protein
MRKLKLIKILVHSNNFSINTDTFDALTHHNLYADNDAWYDFEKLITN